MYKKIAIIGCIILALFFIPSKYTGSVRDFSQSKLKGITTPLTAAEQNWLNSVRSITQLSKLREEKTRLQKEKLVLQQQVVDKQALEAENAQLKKELQINNITRQIPKLFTHVVIRSTSPLQREFTVDIGSVEGVMVGQPAVYQGFLIGKVAKTSEHTSLIKAITAKDSRAQVQLSTTGDKGLLSGDGNIVYISDLPQGETKPEKIIVETSGLGGTLPKGILIGELGAIQSKPSDLSQKYIITLPFEPTSVDNLFILQTEIPE